MSVCAFKLVKDDISHLFCAASLSHSISLLRTCPLVYTLDTYDLLHQQTSIWRSIKTPIKMASLVALAYTNKLLRKASNMGQGNGLCGFGCCRLLNRLYTFVGHLCLVLLFLFIDVKLFMISPRTPLFAHFACQTRTAHC